MTEEKPRQRRLAAQAACKGLAPAVRRPLSQTRSRHTFDVVLRSAIEIFKDMGPAGITFARIANAAGVSVGGVQFHFANRDAIFEAAITQILDENLAAETKLFKDLAASTKGLEDFINLYIVGYYNILREFHPNFVKSIDIIMQNGTLSKKGRETGTIAERMAKSALSDALHRSGLTVAEDRIDAVYHLIFSFVVRELNFPSAPSDSPQFLSRRRALGKMCIGYLRDFS